MIYLRVNNTCFDLFSVRPLFDHLLDMSSSSEDEDYERIPTHIEVAGSEATTGLNQEEAAEDDATFESLVSFCVLIMALIVAF